LTPTGAFNVRATLMVIIVALFLAVGISIGFNIKTRHDDNKLWCEVLPLFDVPVPTPTNGASAGPLTQRDQKIRKGLHDISVGKCGKR
jgi:hypothetical protein